MTVIIKNWGFIPTEQVNPSPTNNGYHVVKSGNRIILRHKSGICTESISMSYTVRWYKFENYFVAKWSKYTIFFSFDMTEIKDPRTPVNERCNWVEIEGNVSFVDEYGEILSTYTPEYCNMRGIDFSNYTRRSVGNSIE
jgi:hypothetical protein